MPMVAAAAAAAVTWVGGAAAAVTGFLAAPLVGLLGEGAAIALAGGLLKGAASLAVSVAANALFVPQVGRGGSPVAFKADPAAPIGGVMGRFGVGGRQLHGNVWGRDNIRLSFVVALSLGPIQAVDSFTANGNLVTFPNAQGLAANVEPYKDKMWQTYRLGLPTDTALQPPSGFSGPTMSEWTTAHTLPGFAQVFWTMQNNSKRASYESGVPTPLWTLLGMKVWDPRQDSTYPGGSGSQRRDQWNTWTYSENPYLHALAWVRGHAKLNTDGTVDRTKRVAGVGAPDEAIDIAAFVEGANVADANDWTIAGEWTTADDKWQVLAAMLQAGGGVPLNRGAQISCMVEAPRTSLLTLTGADIVGPVSLNVMASRRDRPNTIVPRVRLEAQKFEEVALGAVTASTYLAEDGGEPRTREVPYRYVGQAKQGAELAAYGLANARETLKASIPCKPHLLGLRAGDAFTVDEPELGLNGQKFVVVRRAFDPSSAVVTLDVRSETDGKHAFALGQTANPPETPSLTAVDPIPEAPDPDDWTVVVRPPSPGGGQQPGVVVTGTVTSERAAFLLIEHGPTDVGPWTQVYYGPPTTEEVSVDNLDPGATYYLAYSIVSIQGVPSAKTVQGPFTAPALVADDVLPTGPTIAGVIGDLSDLFDDVLDVAADLAATATAVDTLEARTGDAEAEIVDLEIALANEAGARAAAITQVRAEGRTRENICPNGGMEEGLTGISGIRISGSAVSLTLAALDSPNWGRVLGVTPAGAGLYVISWPYAEAIAGQTYTVAGDAAVFGIGSSDQTYYDLIFTGPAGEDLGAPGDGPQNILLGSRNFSDAGVNRDAYAVSAVAPTGTGRVYARFIINCATAPTVIQLRQVKVERGGLPATAYSRDAVDAEVRAEVTENSLAIVDLETQNATAAWSVVAAASGGLPARLGVVSSTLGSFIALDAPYIFFGDDTIFDDEANAFVTVFGDRQRIIAMGQPLGPSSDIWEWEGAASVPLASVTTANADYARVKNGKQYRRGVLQRATRFDAISTTASNIVRGNLEWQPDDGDPETIETPRSAAVVATFMLPFTASANDLLTASLTLSISSATKWFEMYLPDNDITRLGGLYEVSVYNGSTYLRTILRGEYAAPSPYSTTYVPGRYDTVASIRVDRLGEGYLGEPNLVTDTGLSSRQFFMDGGDRLVLRMTRGDAAVHLEGLGVQLNLTTILADTA